MKPACSSAGTAIAFIGMMSCASAVSADQRQDIADAIAWAEPVVGMICGLSMKAVEDAPDDNRSFDIRYRVKGQDQDEGDRTYRLFQLVCNRGAYHTGYIYLTRDGTGYSLLSFAEPKLDYDYADENFSVLKAPPRIVGYTATNELIGGGYDPKTRSISMQLLWRKQADAWSSGIWKLIDGEFVLTQYEVDPTFDPDESSEPSESYQVYPSLEVHRSN